MSIFGHKHIEHYILDFLNYLHSARGLAFTSLANYLNSLVVLAKFWFASFPLSDVSFAAERDRVDAESVLTGLRRVRAQTAAKAKQETLQRPIHAQFLSWHDAQATRCRCLAALQARDAQARADESSSVGGAAKASAHAKAIEKLLQQLVCLFMYTIAPPPR